MQAIIGITFLNLAVVLASFIGNFIVAVITFARQEIDWSTFLTMTDGIPCSILIGLCQQANYGYQAYAFWVMSDSLRALDCPLAWVAKAMAIYYIVVASVGSFLTLLTWCASGLKKVLEGFAMVLASAPNPNPNPNPNLNYVNNQFPNHNQAAVNNQAANANGNPGYWIEMHPVGYGPGQEGMDAGILP
ncbi:Uu.00g061490.m01.CDS01 [Anthostomella pinea]|uniref:Uu.00g061490.m01.CDS01 n=1 Tax=Anthostomella pinea TaxID=933095 RepID=A0AAI8YMK8_9PEZI|nr:Uu.00g061490.m01.CDS01 [Anthostomella pinea]